MAEAWVCKHMSDGILSEPMDLDRRRAPEVPVTIELRTGLRVKYQRLGIVGRVGSFSAGRVELIDDDGRRHVVPNDLAGFRVDGRLASLVCPSVADAPNISASGAVLGGPRRARVARASRIWVEGLHDAALIEKIWGDELREAAVVVEPLHGIDGLAGAVAAFGPTQSRRLGVLVDHLVAGSKEFRIAAAITDPHVLIAGHRHVDVWAAVRPHIIGLDAWPDIDRSVPWKDGICAALGASDASQFWRSLLASVTSFRDLDSSLIGAVEQLLDFVLVDVDS